MKFADHLSKQDIQKFNQLRRATRDKDNNRENRDINKDIPITKPITKKKKQENLSYRDLEDLMGSNNRGLKRKKGGAWSNG